MTVAPGIGFSLLSTTNPFTIRFSYAKEDVLKRIITENKKTLSNFSLFEFEREKN
jgi:hypothetical protein